MKRFLVALSGLVTFSSASFAEGFDAESEKTVNSLAVVEIQKADAGEFLRSLLNPAEILKKIEEQVQSVKDTLLASYDENGNGKIDAGTEFNNMQEGLKALVMVLADSNQNGKIDGEDLNALAKLALEQAKEQVRSNICPVAVKQAEEAGIWLNFRPVLKSINSFCTSEETDAAK